MWSRKLTIEIVYEGGDEMIDKDFKSILKAAERALETTAIEKGGYCNVDSCIAICDPVMT